MCDLGNVPGQLEPTQLRREFVVNFAPAKLRRFCRNKNRLQGFLGINFEKIRKLLMDFFRIDIARYDESEIVWNVTGFVILHHLLLGELVVNLHLTDDWQSIRMSLIRSREQKQTRHPIGIVQIHRELAPDHFLFFRIFFRRQS